MLEFSKESWHYKFLTEASITGDYRIPDSLCPYVRKVFFIIMVNICIYFALLSCILSLFTALIVVPLICFFIGWVSPAEGVMVVLLATGIMLTLLIIVCVIVIAMCGIKNKVIVLGSKKTPATKEPSLIWEFIKTQHDRFCPNIEFKDK